ESPTSYSGMTLVWSDEFDENALNSNNWTQEIGNGDNGWGNNELQYYKPDNTYFASSDYLIIEAKEESESGFDYTSSRMITEGKQEFQYGRIDIRASLPEGQGLWPALWMLGSNFRTSGWPVCGEIDIMEQVGFQPNIVHGTVHYGSSFAQRGSKSAFRTSPSGNEYSESFHVFSLVWEEDHIEILVDDVKYLDVVPTDLGGQAWPYNQSFFFIFNVAIGGQWPGNPDASTVFPQRMIVDYVRVFQ
ncbi:MAG: glycoside hydrolase family 16 protein, partial [Saprospiraceae bacterium]